MEWTTGVPRPQICCILGHAHNIKSFQAKDCTKCMSQGSLGQTKLIFCFTDFSPRSSDPAGR